jgi:transmembrane sensor
MDANNRRARETHEATVWWTLLGSKPPAEVSQADREQFTKWLRESPLHVAELLRVAHVHDSLERFKLWGEIPLESQSESDDIATLPIPLHLRGAGQRNVRRMRELTGNSGLPLDQRTEGHRCWSKRARRWIAAASLAVVVIATAWLAQHLGDTTVRTERAERREVMLSDGSVVSLEPETMLRVNLTKSYRNVSLDHGRALFHVAKDPARPFIVHSGKADVRAVGTVFGVERESLDVVVTVSEGKVAVVPVATRGAGSQRQTPAIIPPREISTGPSSAPALASGQPGEVYLVANQQIRVKKSGEASPIEQVDSNRALAWSAGRLVFDATPLEEVATQFNQYNHVQLRISGSDLARRPVSGVFQASDPETLIAFISAGAHVNVERQGRDAIVISAAP